MKPKNRLIQVLDFIGISGLAGAGAAFLVRLMDSPVAEPLLFQIFFALVAIGIGALSLARVVQMGHVIATHPTPQSRRIGSAGTPALVSVQNPLLEADRDSDFQRAA